MLVYSLAGELILGSRFKRLSDKYLTSVYQIYKQQQIDFEPSWFSIFYILDRYERISITDMSQLLDLTQSAISQMVSGLETRGLIKTEVSSRDKRIKVVSFTEEGRALLKTIKPIWKLIKSKMREMLDEGENSKFLLEALDELEHSFAKKPLHERVLDSLRESGHFFVKYRSLYYLSLKKLVFNWMFNFGAPNKTLVDDFYGFIEDNLNRILVAVKDREVVAAAIGFVDGEFRCIVCDREDVDNRIAFGLVARFIDAVGLPDRVYLDGDKLAIIEFLKKQGLGVDDTVLKKDVNKKLVVMGKHGESV